MTGIFRRRGVDSVDPAAPITGPVRSDRRTKDLVTRLEPGDVAVIDHLDIDTVAAESLVAAQPAAVLNAAESSSGRYPNEGPLLLLRAGIPLVDLDLDDLAHAHFADPFEAERAERMAHRLALRIEHAGLQGHMHPRAHQFTSLGPTWVRPLVRGMTPSRLATSV